MRHARPDALHLLEPLLADLRALPGLSEKRRGVFYAKSRAFLHFHEDPAGLFADLRGAGELDFERFNVTDAEGRARLLEAARARLDQSSLRRS
ncbi:MAG: hypothetical protein Q8S47_16190 [Phenylobacterium sp.]|uniref:hypothetical protein n=1 Tax=Phenylobacterium sp. TaxID=1871053 RepID=UPI0027322154|nr:hypothetical protein [Phenylobacterium sp.]MDP1615989.1 hypothetical protein [Phenylobacterium sp.]MDP1987629.1 hypothetical protein [Phenylobacterium sp.]MDP3384850.1 hypothetical protein [Phenylobacterium sp.]